MNRQDFNYDLPPELIALYPTDERDTSRLLYLDGNTGAIEDHVFTDVIDFVEPGDCVIFNDTKVIPARLFGNKESGGQVEIMVERLLDDRTCLAQLRASKTPRAGTSILLTDTVRLDIQERKGEFFQLNLPQEYRQTLEEILEQHGHVPLPPYIKRDDKSLDRERYQTIYANHPGAVAAPTAGLHFTDDILERLRSRQVLTGFITLHVGAGTFQPVRVESLEDHHMHWERIIINKELCDMVNETRKRGGRIIAVGTTVVRSLESIAQEDDIKPYDGETDIFIYPGYSFKVVDVLITNFHLPESTLLMLVSAFAGRENILSAYQHAIAEKYRFFSYGDAMLINKKSTGT